jgi:hypothetical protein
MASEGERLRVESATCIRKSFVANKAGRGNYPQGVIRTTDGRRHTRVCGAEIMGAAATRVTSW